MKVVKGARNRKGGIAILRGQPGKMCRRHRLSEDSARGRKKSGIHGDKALPEAEPGNSGKGKEPQELEQSRSSGKMQVQRSMEGRRGAF